MRHLPCEKPIIQSMEYYKASDIPLASFLASAAPVSSRRCKNSLCGDGPTSHLRTFLHGNGRITMSVTRLPSGKELPGADKGQIWFWARPLNVSPLLTQHGCIVLELFVDGSHQNKSFI